MAPTRLPVNFRFTPWATVDVDGERLGDTPLPPVPLAAGSHRVRLVKPELEVDR